MLDLAELWVGQITLVLRGEFFWCCFLLFLTPPPPPLFEVGARRGSSYWSDHSRSQNPVLEEAGKASILGASAFKWRAWVGQSKIGALLLVTYKMLTGTSPYPPTHGTRSELVCQRTTRSLTLEVRAARLWSEKWL